MTLQDYQAALEDMLAAMDGEDFSEADVAEAVEAYLGGAEGLGQKLDAYAAVIADAEGKAYLRTLEIERLQKLVKADKHRADWLRARLLSFLQTTGREKIETELHKFRIQANGGVRKVIAPDVEALPKWAVVEVITRRPNNEAIREAIESGKAVPGAALAERGYSVRIA